MTEYRSPIPSRIYNATVGGHVCGPEDVDFGQKVVHLVKYDRSGNEVSFESQVTQANKIYVIHDDFVLSSNVTIPTNCVLEFDGGHLNCDNYSLLGNVRNDYLNVEDFSTTEYIDEALEKIHNICNVAYIPSGNFKLNTTYSIPSTKCIIGSGINSKLYLSESAYIYIHKSVDVELSNFSILINQNSTTPAIHIDGIRYGKLKNLFISSEKEWSILNNQTGILFKQDANDNDYYGSTLSEFSEIRIMHVKFGIILDCSVNVTRDYITNCDFNDILISAFNDTAILIKGKRIFTNYFNNITIQDGFGDGGTSENPLIRKGIDFGGSSGNFMGGYDNRFNGLRTWADAKGREHQFYALYFTSDTALVTHGYGVMTGDIEGLIGRPADISKGAFVTYMSHLRYDISVNLIDSITKITSYDGKLNNRTLEYSNMINILDINDFYSESTTTSSKEIYPNKVRVTNQSQGTILCQISINNYVNILPRLKAFAKIKTDGTGCELRYSVDGYALEYTTLDNSSYLRWTNDMNSTYIIRGYYTDGNFYNDEAHTDIINPSGTHIYLDLPSNKWYRYSSNTYISYSPNFILHIKVDNATYIDVLRFYFISHNLDDKFPFYIFNDADKLFKEMRKMQYSLTT